MKVGGSTLVPPVGETLCESSLIGGCWVEWLFLHVRAVNRSVALVAFSAVVTVVPHHVSI